MNKTILKHGNVVDGTGKVLKDAAVIIEGSAITGIAEAGAIAENDEALVLDLEGMTIMPGMMDLHDHLHGDASGTMHGRSHDRFGEMVHLIDDRDAYQAVLMAENARKALAMGFTTIRDTGSPRDITIDIARAQRDGFFTGPRILYAATIDITFPSYKRQVHGVTGGNITGPVEAVRAVREKVGMGADWLHLNATGAGAGQFGTKTELLSPEEMEAAIREAHKFGLRCTANACGSEGMKKAVLAGVDCIEHGTHIGQDDELIQMMVDRGVGWVPTLYVSIAKQEDAERAAARGQKSSLPEYWLKRELELIELWRQGFEKAVAAGVRTGIGTDAGAPFVYHGNSAKELEIYVRYGMSEMAAIEAATRVNAEILDLDQRLGTVEEGKEADLVVVKEDPLQDIRVLQEPDNIALVLKGGKIVADRIGESWVEARLTNVQLPNAG